MRSQNNTEVSEIRKRETLNSAVHHQSKSVRFGLFHKMDEIPDSTKALCDSSHDDSRGPSSSKRPKRKRCHRIQPNLSGADSTSEYSGEEYIPDFREESSDSDNVTSTSRSRSKSSNPSRGKASTEKRSKSTALSGRKSSDFSRSKSKDHVGSKSLTVSEPNQEPSVYVQQVSTKDGSRKYEKKHYCLYCKQQVDKISRHLARKHNDEIDVAKALSLPKNSRDRHAILDYIRNKGNFEHNREVLDSHKGKLIPCKLPGQKLQGQEFTHCVYCYGLFKKKMMWRHFRKCKLKPEASASKSGRTRVQAMCAFAEPAPSGYSGAYWKFLSCMNQDSVAVALKQDSCLLEFGHRLFKKDEKMISQHQPIRQKLRELCRLLLKAREVRPVKTIKELIKPENYGIVVAATRNLAGYDVETGKYQVPSLSTKVGHSLHTLALFIKSEGLKSKEEQGVKDAEDFVALYKESWGSDIASQALTQLHQQKCNAPQLLPFTQDVQKLHCHLAEEQQRCLETLQDQPSPLNWKNLAKVTLVQVLLFNRRRAGEVSAMPLSAYLNEVSSETRGDVALALTPLEKRLCQHFARIAIVGKTGRKVPVLLTPVMRESLEVLTHHREKCAVPKENAYLFALPQSLNYIRASDCIRQYVSECHEIKNPKALTSTKLRKHVATLSTVLSLKTTELRQLADFLGHDISVRTNNCRLPEATLQLAKISKVLLALEQGRLGHYKGKSLREIQLDVNETVDTEAGNEDEGSDPDADVDHANEDKDDASVPAPQRKKGLGFEECSSSSDAQQPRKSAQKRGKDTCAKRSWTQEECAAVQRHLKKYIVINQVPGKMDCQQCIDAEPQALKNRDWKAVKYFIKNRITALRRKL